MKLRVCSTAFFFGLLAALAMVPQTAESELVQAPAAPTAEGVQNTHEKHDATTAELSAADSLPPTAWDEDLDARPRKGQFRRYFRMTATAYIPIYTRMEGGRYTATQRDGRASHGVAVDPDLIPLGTRLWIPGYGHAIADDTGGWIQGHRVDLRMQNARQMQAWGVRPVRVYVLEEPSASITE